MTEDSQNGTFKPLKLTWLKSAGADDATSSAPSKSAASPQESSSGAPPPSSESSSGAAPAIGLTLVTFKKGVVANKAAEPEASAGLSVDAPPAVAFPEIEPAKAKTVRISGVRLSEKAAATSPSLSPSATSAPVLKPFSFGTKSPEATSVEADGAVSPATRTLGVGVSFAKASDAGLGALPGAEEKRYLDDTKSAARSLHLAKPSEGMRVGVVPDDVPVPQPMVVLAPVVEKPSVATVIKAKAVPGLTRAAPKTRRALPLVAGGVIIALLAAYAAMEMLPAEEAPASVATPAAPVVKPVAAPSAVTVAESTVPAASVTVEPPSVAIPVSNEKNAEIEDWLENATVTFVASKRMTMEGRVFNLGAVVYPVGALRWIGRDSQTHELLFMDENKVIYTKSTMVPPAQ